MSRVLKSPTIIVLLLTSPFILVSICLTYCGAPMLGPASFIEETFFFHCISLVRLINQVCSTLPDHHPTPSEPVKLLSHVRLFAIPWTVAYQAPPSMEFSRQKYWSGLPLPSPGDLSDPGIEPRSPTLQADDLPSELPGKPTLSLVSLSRFNLYIYINSIPGSGRSPREGNGYTPQYSCLEKPIDGGAW